MTVPGDFPLLYAPATNVDITQVVNEQANTLQQLQTGVKPLAPNFQTALARRHNETSTQLFFTFPAAAHIWSAVLSFTIVTNGAYAPGITKCFADLTTGVSNLGLLTLELGVANVSDHDSNAVSNIWNGLAVALNDTLILNINNGTTIANLNQQASCIVGYSIP